MKITIFILTIILFLVSGCTQKNYQLLRTEQNITTHSQTKQMKFEYYILPHDRLKISIYKNPEESELIGAYSNLSTNMTSNGILVNAYGKISLPLIGRVKVSGLTQEQASSKIAKRYEKYLRRPTVYLEAVNKRAYILGEVKKPGVLKLDKEQMTLLEAIAFSEGLTNSAVREEIVIIHHDRSGKMQMRKINLTNFDTLSRENMTIVANDVIYIKPDKWKNFSVSSKNISSMLSIVGVVAQPAMAIKYLAE